jgi:benzoylformate decarboxylase
VAPVTKPRTGADAFIAQLVEAGVKYVFGNPGTTEEPFLGRVKDHDKLTFVTALHESVAVGAAEGYARASREIGVVEVHAGPGLGNAMGMLYNAAEGRTPLLVYVGQVEQAGMYLEPTLGGDFVAMARPIAKWAHEVRTVNEIPQVVRRAIKTALTDPCGPVVLAIPMDLMEQACQAEVAAVSLVPMAVSPDQAALNEAVEVISAAERPAIVVGDGVARADAIDHVADLARTVAAPIYGGFMTETCVDPDNPLNGGRLPSIEGEEAARVLAAHDCIIAVGTKLLSQIFPLPAGPVGPASVVHVGLDPWELGKNHPSALLFGHEREALRVLTPAVADRLRPHEEKIRQRRIGLERALLAKRVKSRELDQAGWNCIPMTPARAIAEISALLPAGAIIVDESLTAYGEVARYVRLERGRWFRLRGGGIGEGMPMPVGIQLARPSTKVIAFVGDGSSLYTPTAMWTAAHLELPICWFVLNNHSYRVLKENARRGSSSTAAADRLVGVDLDAPLLDFTALAAGFGVGALRVSTPREIKAAVPDALRSQRPMLIDVQISAALTKR